MRLVTAEDNFRMDFNTGTMTTNSLLEEYVGHFFDVAVIATDLRDTKLEGEALVMVICRMHFICLYIVVIVIVFLCLNKGLKRNNQSGLLLMNNPHFFSSHIINYILNCMCLSYWLC